jgi:glycosyltransferase involved in cell wall biosynthesis
MKISLIIPSNRKSYSAMARILECASLDPSKFEVIVRDNSENEAKRALISLIDSPTLRFVTVPNRGAFENPLEGLRLATGEFIFFLADDDWLSARGIEQLHALAMRESDDATVGCLTGTYFIQSSTKSGLFRYPDLHSANPATRFTAYLTANGPNVLYYSAVRRSLAEFCFAFVESIPYKFSFHDQLISMLYLALGRTLQVDQVVYFYDLGEWETWQKSLAKDRAMYVDAGLPLEIDRLHWLLCGMEGGFLLNSVLLSAKGTYDRKELADLWFANMFTRFKDHNRETGYESTAINEGTLKLKNKWISEAEVNLNELLFDVCDILESVDPSGAERYFKFWSSL